MTPHGLWTDFGLSWVITCGFALRTVRTTSVTSVRSLGTRPAKPGHENPPSLVGDLPLPDDYELFCQDLEDVIQDLNSFAEYHAAAPCPLAPASSQSPVAPQLPVVRQYLARYSEVLAFNVGAVPVAVATFAVYTSNSTSRNGLPE